MPNPLYEPAEDSYFLAEIISDYLKKLSKKEKDNIKILDMGTGSGVQSINCLKVGISNKNIFAIDINKEAIKHVKNLNLGIKTIKSNLFSKLPTNKNNKFNLIIFNPPYLPEDKYNNLPDTTGGKHGDEIIIKFVKQLSSYLEKNGVCFLLTSSLTPESRWKNEIKKQKLNVNKIKTKNLFQEKLYVWKITKG
ncbi:methyltransferase domain-containing protein [Candidatus Pacearchaeota archaeon]|nr:methyltransferase domain-containing protein [Candidatus Pacearchaeota archaeon]